MGWVRASMVPALAVVALAGCSPGAPPPAVPAPAAAATPTTGPVQIEVPLEADHGTFLVPVTLNSTLQVKATLDSGASDVVLPSQVAEALVRGGTIAERDYIGDRTYVLADGSRVPSRVINLRSLKVGTLELANVRAAVGGAGSSLLLGQSFLSRLTNWSIDNRRHVLLLNDTLDANDRISTPQTPPGVAPPKTTILPPSAESDRKIPHADDEGSDEGRGDRGRDDAGDRPPKSGYGGKPAAGSGHKEW